MDTKNYRVTGNLNSGRDLEVLVRWKGNLVKSKGGQCLKAGLVTINK